ncbi:hypothetical protein ACSBR1_001362 [Camellia fascicularis]
MSTIIKRRKTKIEVLKNGERVWVDNPMQLKSLVNDYFQNLFVYTQTISLDHWSNLTKHISPEDQSEMSRNVFADDIWRAVKNIKAFKAPGRDGF